jgi:hypothetical protein
MQLLIHHRLELLLRGIALVAIENALKIASLRFTKVLANKRGNESVEINHASLPTRRCPVCSALPGLLRLDEQRLGSFAGLAIGSQVERIEGEIGMAAGRCRAALDCHETTGTQQLPQSVEVVEPLMALAQTGQAHDLFAESARQKVDHGPNPE